MMRCLLECVCQNTNKSHSPFTVVPINTPSYFMWNWYCLWGCCSEGEPGQRLPLKFSLLCFDAGDLPFLLSCSPEKGFSLPSVHDGSLTEISGKFQGTSRYFLFWLEGTTFPSASKGAAVSGDMVEEKVSTLFTLLLRKFISTFPSVSHPQLQVRFGKHLNNPAIYLGVIKISNLVKNDFTFVLKIPITLIWLCILSIPRVCVINVLFCFFKQTFVREQYYENLVFDLAKIGWGCLVGLSKENFYCSTKCLWLCAIKKCGKYFWLLTI